MRTGRKSRLRAAHPEVSVQLFASPGGSDFARESIDLDIRYGTGYWPKLYVQSIFAEEVMPMVSPRLQARLNVQAPEDLLLQELILCEPDLIQWPQWFSANGVGLCPSEYALRVDRAQLSIDAAVQGFGIALQSSKLADGFLKNGQLAPVFPDHKSMRLHQHYLVYPSPHHECSKVLKFAAWLHTEAAK